MSTDEQDDGLRTQHAKLERLIDDELHRPMPDQTTLTRLKREKLRVKEEIEHVRPHEAPGMAHGGGMAASLA